MKFLELLELRGFLGILGEHLRLHHHSKKTGHTLNATGLVQQIITNSQYSRIVANITISRLGRAFQYFKQQNYGMKFSVNDRIM